MTVDDRGFRLRSPRTRCRPSRLASDDSAEFPALQELTAGGLRRVDFRLGTLGQRRQSSPRTDSSGLAFGPVGAYNTDSKASRARVLEDAQRLERGWLSIIADNRIGGSVAISGTHRLVQLPPLSRRDHRRQQLSRHQLSSKPLTTVKKHPPWRRSPSSPSSHETGRFSSR